jgi:chemotaxis signal transduction protein
MALHSAQTTNTSKASEKRQVFTFFIEDMMFGLNVDYVLMLGQDVDSIQKVPVEERGLKGVIKYQGIVVPVLDFAHRVGVTSGIDSKLAVIDELRHYEQEHIDWMNALEAVITSGGEFKYSTELKNCKFSQWRKQFHTRDETLIDMLALFDVNQQALYETAERLLTLRDSGNTDEAIELLHRERGATIQRMKTLFSRVIEHLQAAMRQVLLFVTDDGKTPRFALLIDEINDVVTYDASEFQASNAGALAQLSQIGKVLDGIYTRDNSPDCLYFNIDKLIDEPITVA